MAISTKTNSTKSKIQKNDLGGTFAKSLKAPIHRWFRFPAGYSYAIVEDSFKKFKVTQNSLVLDPFAGSGTTNVCSKNLGISSIGIESHPFVAWIANVKTRWNLDFQYLEHVNNELITKTRKEYTKQHNFNFKILPELLQKCFTEDKMKELMILRENIIQIEEKNYRDFFFLSLISILRKVSIAHTGWPYVLPRKTKPNNVNVLDSFEQQTNMMISDLKTTVTDKNKNVKCNISCSDARNLTKITNFETIDFAFTSPPYLNNFDYADRTRLELYFATPYDFGDKELDIKTWTDLAKKIRSKLIISTTHQAVEMKLRDGLQPSVEIESSVRNELIDIANYLQSEKTKHGGHKEYDLLVIGYFNDMYKIIKEVYDSLKPHSYFMLILGDSAPYGRHVPTDKFLSKIAMDIGFSNSKIEVLRERGGKWITAPKHNVPLRESMVILKK